jgi:hypothetical protein
MEEKDIRALFNSHPEAKELYLDANGICWTKKEIAVTQSKGEKVTTLKRSDYLKTSKTE